MANQGPVNIQGIQAPGNQGGLLPFLSQLIGGYTQAHQQKVDSSNKQKEFEQTSKKNDQDYQLGELTMQEKQAQMAAAAQATAKSKYQEMTQGLITNPEMGKDPNTVQKYKELADTAGEFPMLAKDGTIDVNRMKPSFNTAITADPKVMAQINNMPAGPAKTAYLDQFSGVPKELYKAGVQLGARDSVALQKVQAQMGHWINTEAINKERADTNARYYDGLGNLIPGKEALLAADTAKANAQASATKTLADVAVSRANTYAASVQNVMTRFQQSPNSSMGLVRSYLSTSSAEKAGALRAVNEATKNLATVMGTSPDPDSPEVVQATAAVQAAQQAYEAADKADSQLRTEIRANPQVSAFIGSASGNRVTNVTPPKTSGKGKPVEAAPGVADGTTGGGGKYVARGGQWYVK